MFLGEDIWFASYQIKSVFIILFDEYDSILVISSASYPYLSHFLASFFEPQIALQHSHQYFTIFFTIKINKKYF